MIRLRAPSARGRILLFSLFAAFLGGFCAESYAQSASLQESSFFSGADGARIHYRYRTGAGPALVLVHGITLGGEGFDQWPDAFPGRAMLILDRRGYGSSEQGSINLDNFRALSQSDIVGAVERASRLGDGGKRLSVGLVAFSLGGALLPDDLDPERVSWIALANPAVFGMMEYPMNPISYANFQSFLSSYTALASAPPGVRDAWIEYTGNQWIAGTILQIRSEGDASSPSFGEGLISRILRQANDTESGSKFKELILRESYWILSSKQDSGSPKPSIDPRIPVFLGNSRWDELIPAGAYAALTQQLQGQRGSDAWDRREWSGWHLTPLLVPNSVIPLLQRFDQQHGVPSKIQ